MPRKGDLEQWEGQIKWSLKEEIETIHQELVINMAEIRALKTKNEELERRISELERDQQTNSCIYLSIKVEDAENKSRKDNIRLRGGPRGV